MTSPSSSAGRLKRNHKLLVGLVLSLGVVVVLVIFFSHRGLYQVYRLRHERLRLEEENARLAAENSRLARTIDRLQHDPELIQDLIRRELNFVKKNEVIFQLPPEEPGPAPVAPSSSSQVGAHLPGRPHPEASPKAGKPTRAEGAPQKGSGPPGR